MKLFFIIGVFLWSILSAAQANQCGSVILGEKSSNIDKVIEYSCSRGALVKWGRAQKHYYHVCFRSLANSAHLYCRHDKESEGYYAPKDYGATYKLTCPTSWSPKDWYGGGSYTCEKTD